MSVSCDALKERGNLSIFEWSDFFPLCFWKFAALAWILLKLSNSNSLFKSLMQNSMNVSYCFGREWLLSRRRTKQPVIKFLYYDWCEFI